MGIKERKIREKENLRKLIIANAHEILMKNGLEGLTMRALANNIEFSQSKIYEFFTSKDQIYEVLCKDLCEKLLNLLKEVPEKQVPDNYLSDLILKTIEFHGSHPHSDPLFTLVCFGPQRFKIPEEFLEIEQFFLKALKNLKSPYLKTSEELMASLDIIRCIFIGVSTLMATETSVQGRTRALNITKNALSVLLRGWK